jgi:hypothetical protein
VGWLNVLWAAWSTGWSIGRALAGSGQQQLSNLYAALSAGIGNVNDYVNQLFYSLYHINQAWQGMNRMGPLINARLGNALMDTNRSIDWIVRGIIPATVKAATSHTGTSLSGVWSTIRHIEYYQGRDETSIRNLWSHINRYVNPADNSWNAWRRWWNRTGSVDWRILDLWIRHPALLSDKLMATMTPDVVWELQQAKQRPTLYKLMAVLARDAAGLPARYPAAAGWVDRAAVAVLNSGHYPG